MNVDKLNISMQTIMTSQFVGLFDAGWSALWLHCEQQIIIYHQSIYGIFGHPSR